MSEDKKPVNTAKQESKDNTSDSSRYDKENEDKEEKDYDVSEENEEEYEDEEDGYNEEEEDENEEKIDKEKATAKTMSGVKRALKNVKETLMTLVKIIKLIIKFIGFLVKLGWVGLIIGVVILVLIIIMVLSYSFTEENNGDAGGWRSQFDSQDLLAQDKYEDRTELREQMQDIQDKILSGMDKEEYQQLRKEILDFNDSVSGYGDELMSFYDTHAGYQILNQDATIILMLERLSYAYKYTDWEPDYDINAAKEEKAEELRMEIEEEESKSQDERSWSAMKMRKKKEELDHVLDDLKKLDATMIRYKELNLAYSEKYKKEFIESSRESRINPAGNELEDKVVSYFKDRYGVETTQVKEQLSYFHTIIVRTLNYHKVIEGEDASGLNDFLNTPSFTSEEHKAALDGEKDDGISLQEVEDPYKVSLEIMHHEATLKLIKYQDILNDLLRRPEGIETIKESLSKHMPIFEYATYDDKVIKKTFYDYDLFDKNYFDGEGNYLYDDEFDHKLGIYTKHKDTNIDFSKVEGRAQDEYTLEQYKVQLAEQEGSSKPDRIMIEELNQLISELEDKLAEEPNSEEQNEIYKSNYKNVQEKAVMQSDEDRMYDPHNHNIFVDTKKKYYMEYADTIVDNYNEKIAVTETLKYGTYSGEGKVTYGSWEDTSDSKPIAECSRNVVSVVDSKTVQTSLKPSKIRTIFNSANYKYTKTEKREKDAEKLISDARANSTWQKRKIYVQPKLADGSYGDKFFAGYEYRLVTKLTINNYGAVVGCPEPFETNEELVLNNQTFLTDFYGQTELLSEEELVTSPGDIIDPDLEPGDEHYDPASVSIIYYNQADYPNQYYGRSTIKATGCGPTSLAMVVDSLTNANIGVVGMCQWAYSNGYKVDGSGSRWALIPEGARHFGLSVNEISRKDKNSLVNALQSRHPVIMICGPGQFTSSGHFMVLTGIDENGMVSINDPGSRARTGQKWSINTILANASSKQGPGANTFWEIY